MLPAFVFLWSFWLLCFAALGAGQSAQAAVGGFDAAGIGTGARAMDGLWQFHLGDDPDGKLGWAQPGFDDSQWERRPADKPWAEAGHPGYTGFAWYRRQIVLDPSDKNPLGLLVPSVETVAEVYWNGVKVGGVGTMLPHPMWYWTQPPVAVPLPSPPGAGSGTLAIRVWAPHYASSNGGLLEPIQLGYMPLLVQMGEGYLEHRLHFFAIMWAMYLIQLCVGLTALVLWLRWPSQRLLLCIGIYYVSFAIAGTLAFGSFSLTRVAQDIVYDTWDWINDTAFLFLILLLAGLPNRPGIRGFRFWKRICLASSSIVLVGEILQGWQAILFIKPASALTHFLDRLYNIRDFTETLSVVLVLIACMVLGRPRLPRLLFMSTAALQILLLDLNGYVNIPSMNAFLDRLGNAVFLIHGSSLDIYTASNLLLLLAVIYAVWDQLSRELADQRRANAELKAAHEVQTMLIAAEERNAPGYAVASVYRPASEVGGDFFQVIPLDEDSTLIVAGDVSGKGLRAAMTVSLIIGTVRTLVEQDSSPATVLAGLNRRLIGRTQGGFATCCAVRIDPTGHAVMANAGHCQPYLDGLEVELPSGLPLGLVDGMMYEEVAVTIANGQQLTLVSDGVVEARNHHGELYGFERLSQLMQGRPTADHVANTAIDFGQDDDITVLTVTRLLDLSPALA